MRLFEGTPFDIPPRCDRCGELAEACQCAPEKTKKEWAKPETQRVVILVEKRKRGKWMTVLRGLDAATSDLETLLTQLKTDCGAGGTIRGNDLEIQGNHLKRIANLLATMGFQVRGSS